MDVDVGDRLYIDIAVDGTEWTQTVLNLANMKTVDFTMDLKGQDQNWVIWEIETPGYSKPIEDTIFEKTVITFTSPVTSCQPTSAFEVDYFSAPILSVDPGMGDTILILAFVVIVIGGIGSIRGAFLAALLIGLVDTLGRSFSVDILRLVMGPSPARTVGPAIASMLIYLLMAVVLYIRPSGLFPAKGR